MDFVPSLPDHCKDVSLRHVDFPLTRENILSNFQDKIAYTRTDFMILRNGEDTATVKVTKQKGKDLFRPVVGLEVISLPEDTVFIHDEEVDVLNVSSLPVWCGRTTARPWSFPACSPTSRS